MLVFLVGRDRAMEQDRLGRRRTLDQERGLRPLHPLLPDAWTSKAVRIAMSEEDWLRFESLTERWAGRPEASTQARAFGLALSSLLEQAARPIPGPLEWMDWERKKTLRLLRTAM